MEKELFRNFAFLEGIENLNFSSHLDTFFSFFWIDCDKSFM